MNLETLLADTMKQSMIMSEWLANKIIDNQLELDCMARAEKTQPINPFNPILVRSELLTEMTLEESINWSLCKDYIEQGMDWEDPYGRFYND